MRALLTLLIFGVLTVCPVLSQAKANPKYASIVMDADTGKILHQRHANKSLHPASLTKIMTLLMVFEALEEGRIGLKDRIPISSHAASMVPSKLGLKPGSSIRVRDAIAALTTKSANDVAAAIAEKLGGSERGFANMMNRKAIQIGMTRTTFRNASGLHHPRQVSTARDMAKLARHLINDYPRYYKNFARRNFTYAGKTYRNHNRLLGKYKGMDGIKTGYISAAGFNLVSSAVRNDRRIIGVVFGGRTSKTRNAHMAELMDRGFSKLNDIRMARADVPLPARKPAYLNTLASLDNQRLSVTNPALQAGLTERLGQGDFDAAASRRFETGLLAIAAHKGEKAPKTSQFIKKIAIPKETSNSQRPWSIQIGAFETRASTDRALQNLLKKLPQPYNQAFPIIAPLKTADGWLFRARLSGYTQTEAFAACRHIKDCLPVAPNN